ncbi:MAG: hypothetical protein PHX02_04635 [Oscillospiraceae bacterium]|nr:hypothetical protein [Oscillospiraceae bacterium]
MDENMLRMQQEAVERVRQMQERARKFVEKDEAPESHAASNKNPKAIQQSCPKQNLLQANKNDNSLLGGFIGDQEQLLLLILAVLLIKSEARIELVLALLYIAM